VALELTELRRSLSLRNRLLVLILGGMDMKNGKIFAGLGAALVGLAGAYKLAQSRKLKDQVEVLTEVIEQRVGAEEQVDDAWIELMDEPCEYGHKKHIAYRGGFRHDDKFNHIVYEFIADAKTGEILKWIEMKG
jgi:predicted small secreted protein